MAYQTLAHAIASALTRLNAVVDPRQRPELSAGERLLQNALFLAWEVEVEDGAAPQVLLG